MNHIRWRVFCITLLVMILFPYLILAEQDLAKQAQNPIANLISLPLQNNTNFGIGPDDETQNILNIQPVWPFSMGDGWNLITRTIIPVVSQPDILTGGEGRINGLGDTTFTGFFSLDKVPFSTLILINGIAKPPSERYGFSVLT